MKFPKALDSPARISVSAFALLIFAGTGLLMLPGASTDAAMGLVDALFTATSASCVTGLIVVDTAKDLTLFGGVDHQQLLYKSADEVRQGVKELIHHYAPGGGYIFGTGHNIEPDTPIENIPAMYEAALEYGQYPVKI